MTNITPTSNVSIQSLSTEDIMSMPVDVCAFYLAVVQTNSLDNQIQQKMLEMQSKQSELAQARQLLAKMKELQDKAGDDDDCSEMPADMAQWLDNHGVDYDRTGNDLWHNKNEWNINIEHLNAWIQNYNSSIELDMLQIQSLMNKRNQSLEMASNIMKKSTEAKEAILRNI